jgi:hypothetical protein
MVGYPWLEPPVRMICLRDAWKNFEGFPIKSAQIAYVFLVNQLNQEILLQNQSNDDEKPSAEENVMSVAVSSFAAPLV